MDDKIKYEANGYLDFVLSVDGIQTIIIDKKDILKGFNKDDSLFKKDIYYLISGEEFFKDVNNGCIINYDGDLENVFVDGFISNLGLCHKGFNQGNFLVDGEIWMSICKNHKVEVNWANK